MVIQIFYRHYCERPKNIWQLSDLIMLRLLTNLFVPHAYLPFLIIYGVPGLLKCHIFDQSCK